MNIVGISGTSNSAFGYNALTANTTGTYNNAFGSSALQNNTTGSSNSAVGMALTNNTTGYANNAVGYFALNGNTTGTYNSAFGTSALQNNTTGSDNVAMGRTALAFNLIGGNNVAIGSNASAYFYGYGTVAVGTCASQYNINDSGCLNTAVGNEALRGVLNCNNGQNTAVGGYALTANTTGTSNTAVGVYALSGNTIGQYNLAIGYSAGSGQVNVLSQPVTQSYNTYLGCYTGILSGGNCNYSTAIGYGSAITAPNQIMMGRASETVVVPGATYTCGGNILFGNPINTSITYTGTGGTSGGHVSGSYATITFPVCVTPTVASTGILTLTLMLSGNANFAWRRSTTIMYASGNVAGGNMYCFDTYNNLTSFNLNLYPNDRTVEFNINVGSGGANFVSNSTWASLNWSYTRIV